MRAALVIAVCPYDPSQRVDLHRQAPRAVAGSEAAVGAM